MSAPSITCPNCSRSYAIKPELLGKRVKCKCGERITFPDTLPTSSAPVPGKIPLVSKPAASSAPPLPATSSSPEEIEELGPMDLADAPTQTGDTFPCGGCQQAIPVGTILCTHCGYNQRTGQKVATTVVRTVQKAPRKAPASAPANYDDEVTGLEWVLVVLCPGIACILGIVKLVQGKSSGWTLIIASFVMNAIWVGIKFAISGAVGK